MCKDLELPRCGCIYLPVSIQRRHFAPGLLALGLLAGMTSALPALAQDKAPPRMVEGQPFVQRLNLVGSDLRLNGTGVRAVAWFKGYAAGLYLTRPGTSMAEVLDAPGPKRLQLRMLQDVPAEEFVKALNKGVERNTPAAEMPALRPQMQAFAEHINKLGTVRKGDTVDLDLDPARGMLFSVNGTLRAEPLPGDGLHKALLRSFLGDHPYDRKLKAGLLRGPEN
ncbi:MAG: chalcone isomerase family protein [Rubrivivax sp.]|nr:chalcone isomerase family protein [Rubrivivax sp.]